MNRRQTAIVVLMALAVVFVLGAAMGQAEPAKTRAVVAQGVDTEGIDVTFISSTASLNVMHHVLEPLMLRDENMVLQPVLATSWGTLDEYTWQFKLRQGVKFHSGYPFTSEAVKVTFERMFDPEVKTSHRAVRDIPFDRVEIIDDYTVNIVTKEPTPLMPHFLRTVLIIDPSVYKGQKTAFFDRASGTGPYKFAEWARDDHLTLTANEDYWNGKPQIDEVVFRPIPEASTRIAELLTGAVDLIVNIPPDQTKRIETDKTKVAVSKGGRDIFIGLHCDRPPFDDVRVRQAVNYAIDLDTINQALLGGMAEPYGAVAMPPNDHPGLEPYPYDVKKAKALLAEAGYAKGLEITLQTPNGRYLKDKEASQAIAGYLQAVGIRTKVEALDWSVFTSKWLSGESSEMFFIGLGGWFDGQGELTWLLPEISVTGWENEEFRQVFNELAKTFDENRRYELILEGQEIAYQDAPWVFLWRQPSIYGVSKRLDWTPRRDEYIFLWDASITD